MHWLSMEILGLFCLMAKYSNNTVDDIILFLKNYQHFIKHLVVTQPPVISTVLANCHPLSAHISSTSIHTLSVTSLAPFNC